jgi:uncharacterized protein
VSPAAETAGRLRRILIDLGIGLVAGLVSGFVGGGGGIVIVPLLVIFAALSQHQAHATSLAAIVPIAAVGAARFAAAESVDLRLAALLAVGSLVGAPLGARLLARVGEGGLRVMLGILMVAVSIQLLLA